MGNTCKPMAVSFQCMTKPTTIKKKKRSPKKEAHKGISSPTSSPMSKVWALLQPLLRLQRAVSVLAPSCSIACDGPGCIQKLKEVTSMLLTIFID